MLFTQDKYLFAVWLSFVLFYLASVLVVVGSVWWLGGCVCARAICLIHREFQFAYESNTLTDAPTICMRETLKLLSSACTHSWHLRWQVGQRVWKKWDNKQRRRSFVCVCCQKSHDSICVVWVNKHQKIEWTWTNELMNDGTKNVRL